MHDAYPSTFARGWNRMVKQTPVQRTVQVRPASLTQRVRLDRTLPAAGFAGNDDVFKLVVHSFEQGAGDIDDGLLAPATGLRALLAVA
jgi:hypothetical protein